MLPQSLARTIPASSPSASTLSSAAVAVAKVAELGAPVGDPGTPLADSSSRLASIVDRRNPRGEQQALRIIQESIIATYTLLNNYLASPRLEAREVVLQAIADLDHNLANNQISNKFSEVKSATSKYQKQTEETQAAFHGLTGRASQVAREKQRLNLQAISQYQSLIAHQVRLASIYAHRRSSTDFNLQNFVRNYLKAALSNTARLMNELNWSARRQETGAKTHQIATVDFLGRTIWASNTKALDITRTGEGAQAVTHIRRGIYLHPHSRARTILVDLLKAGVNDPEAVKTAVWKLDEMIAAFPESGGALFVAGQAGAQRQSLLDFKQAITTKQSSGELKAKLVKVREAISADYNIKVNRDIAHTKDSRSGARSIIHTIESHADDYADVSFQLTNLEHDANLLRQAVVAGHLRKDGKNDAVEILSNMFTWADHGEVPEKRRAKILLAAMPAQLEAAYKAQRKDKPAALKVYTTMADQLVKVRENPEDFKLPAEPTRDLTKLKTVADLLENRLASILKISKHSTDRLNALLIDMKDTDLAGSAARVVELYKSAQYDEASKLISDMNDLYLKYHSPELGYRRVRASMERMYQLLQQKNDRNLLEMEHLRDLVIADTAHKFDKRVTVVDVDAKVRQYVYVPADTTLKDLPARALRNKKFLAVENGTRPHFLQERSLAADPIQDASQLVYLLAQSKPNGTIQGIPQSFPKVPC